MLSTSMDTLAALFFGFLQVSAVVYKLLLISNFIQSAGINCCFFFFACVWGFLINQFIMRRDCLINVRLIIAKRRKAIIHGETIKSGLDGKTVINSGGMNSENWITLFNVISTSVNLLYSHLHVHAASQRHNIKDRRMKKGSRKEDTGRLL